MMPLTEKLKLTVQDRSVLPVLKCLGSSFCYKLVWLFFWDLKHLSYLLCLKGQE